MLSVGSVAMDFRIHRWKNHTHKGHPQRSSLYKKYESSVQKLNSSRIYGEGGFLKLGETVWVCLQTEWSLELFSAKARSSLKMAAAFILRPAKTADGFCRPQNNLWQFNQPFGDLKGSKSMNFYIPRSSSKGIPMDTKYQIQILSVFRGFFNSLSVLY